jgi:hypothetical protein
MAMDHERTRVLRWIWIVAMGAVFARASWLLAREESLGLGAGVGLILASVIVGAFSGWAVRQLWLYPRRLQQAERLWAAQAPASEVAEKLSSTTLARGELGYRIGLLRAQAHLALGYRDRAWLDLLNAQLGRLPWWKRWRVARFFREVPANPDTRRLDWGERLKRAAPRMARVHHIQGLLRLRCGSLEQAWIDFAEALVLGWDDPLLLEDVMLAGLNHGRVELAEQALVALMPWRSTLELGPGRRRVSPASR